MTDQENFQETVAPTIGPAATDSTETQNLNRLAMLHISITPSPTAVPESTSAAERRKTSSSADQEKFHSAKRLKRMKDRMREMSQWREQVLLEGEEDIDKAPKNHGSKNDNEEVPALPRPLRRASTAPSSTFDTVLREKGFNRASDQDKLDRAKRSKRMKECSREMSQWCGQVICEDEEHFGCDENNNYTCKDHVLKSETEEVPSSAWYEKAGESVVIQFKCPCEKVYELLLSENHIYYKLMPFQQDESEKEDREKSQLAYDYDKVLLRKGLQGPSVRERLLLQAD